MRDTELYYHILGLKPPWTVAKVELSMKEHQVDVWVEHPEATLWKCPVCKKEMSLYDHSEERVWRHLDTCGFKTILHARPPRVDCPDHGVKQVILPWAEDHSRFTAIFECFAINVLLESNIQGGSEILKISWDEAWNIAARAVERGLMTKEIMIIPFLAIDEKSVKKGHNYITIVTDLLRGKVIHVSHGRSKESLDAYFRTLTPEQLDGIQAIAIDMCEYFFNSIVENVPGGKDKIVFDRYHLMTHMLKAVDEVRKKENFQLCSDGNTSLVKSRYMWLYSKENLPDRYEKRFKTLKGINLKTGRAYAIKENLRELWNCESIIDAKSHWKHWFTWAIHSRLEPVKEVAHTIRSHLHNVMTYFTHRITNAVSEGMNSVIQMIKQRACGFKNEEHFKTAILFHCGDLNLYPVTHGNVQ
jgi:transposase